MSKNILKIENTNHEKNNYLESKKLVVKNNYWNEDHELLLESLQKSCFRISKEYKQKYFKLRDKLQWYRIPIIIISSIGGFLSLSNSGYIPPYYNKWVSLFVGFTNLAVTIISLIESFKKIDTRMNGSYTTYVNFQKLHDEISIIKRIPPNERENNGNDTVNNLFAKYESYFADAPIIRKLINDDIGFNEFEDIQTPKILSSISDIESQMIEMKTKLNKINLEKKSGFLHSISSKLTNGTFNNDCVKTNFKSKFNYDNFYNSYNYENENENKTKILYENLTFDNAINRKQILSRKNDTNNVIYNVDNVDNNVNVDNIDNNVADNNVNVDNVADKNVNVDNVADNNVNVDNVDNQN